MTEKQINYLNKINSIFVGQKIKNVHYEVILYEDQEYWEFSNEIHSVDMNIILELDNDKFFKVLWDNEFECYGIGVYEINELKPDIVFFTGDLIDRSVKLTNEENKSIGEILKSSAK